MSTPIATLTDMTATGDVITGPGYSKVIIKGMPVACLGDLVSGGTVVGSITTTQSPNIIIGGRPVASLGCTVVGTNPATGIPMTSAIGSVKSTNKIV